MKRLSNKVIAQGIASAEVEAGPNKIRGLAGNYRRAGYLVPENQIMSALREAGWTRSQTLIRGRSLEPSRAASQLYDRNAAAFYAVLNDGPVQLDPQGWANVKGHLLVRFGNGNTAMPQAATIRRWAGMNGQGARSARGGAWLFGGGRGAQGRANESLYYPFGGWFAPGWSAPAGPGAPDTWFPDTYAGERLAQIRSQPRQWTRAERAFALIPWTRSKRANAPEHVRANLPTLWAEHPDLLVDAGEAWVKKGVWPTADASGGGRAARGRKAEKVMAVLPVSADLRKHRQPVGYREVVLIDRGTTDPIIAVKSTGRGYHARYPWSFLMKRTNGGNKAAPLLLDQASGMTWQNPDDAVLAANEVLEGAGWLNKRGARGRPARGPALPSLGRGWTARQIHRGCPAGDAPRGKGRQIIIFATHNTQPKTMIAITSGSKVIEKTIYSTPGNRMSTELLFHARATARRCGKLERLASGNAARRPRPSRESISHWMSRGARFGEQRVRKALNASTRSGQARRVTLNFESPSTGIPAQEVDIHVYGRTGKIEVETDDTRSGLKTFSGGHQAVGRATSEAAKTAFRRMGLV